MLAFSKKHFLIVILIFSINIYSCSPQNKTSRSKEYVEIINTYNVSLLTREFINDINKELEKSYSTFSNYIPSDELIYKYGIRRKGHNLFISAYIHTGANFQKEKLEEIGVYLNTPQNNINSVYFKFNLLPQLLEYPNITYFEILEKQY